MPIARPEPQDARVVAHVDMDCFYVQVEQRKRPELRGLPVAVVPNNSWKGGGLIAVGYEARKFGVKRFMRGDEARKVCPNIQLVQVPVARGKADLNSYRDAGSEVISILATKGRCERASIDEVYLDLTDAAEAMLLDRPPEMLDSFEEEALKSHILGLTDDANERESNVRRWLCRGDADHRDKLLACGAIIVAQLRIQVLKETEFTCAAGIAHNKMLAKLATAMHKPAQQTVVPSSSVKDLLASLPVKKMKQLGGKLGTSLQSDLGVDNVGDLLQYSMETLQERYGTNTGTWLWNIARGISGDEVQGRLLPKSHGCGKTFPGPQALKSIASVEHWLNQLCEELNERLQSDLDQNKRIAHTLTLYARAFKANDLESQRKFPSKSCPLRYGTTKIQEDAMKLFNSGLHDFLGPCNKGWGITSLSVAASKILDAPHGTCSILKFFQGKSLCTASNDSNVLYKATVPSSPSGSRNYITLDEREQQPEIACEEFCNDNDTSKKDKSPDKAEKIMRKSKGKESSSILRYFAGTDSSCSSTMQVLDGSNQVFAPLSPSGPNKIRLPEEGSTDSGVPHNDQTLKRYDTWTYNIEDIDHSVIDELPAEIQKELQAWLHVPKRANTAKRGASIAHYFLPAKKS